MLNRCLNSHRLHDKPLHAQRLTFIYLNRKSAEGETANLCQYLLTHLKIPLELYVKLVSSCVLLFICSFVCTLVSKLHSRSYPNSVRLFDPQPDLSFSRKSDRRCRHLTILSTKWVDQEMTEANDNEAAQIKRWNKVWDLYTELRDMEGDMHGCSLGSWHFLSLFGESPWPPGTQREETS